MLISLPSLTFIFPACPFHFSNPLSPISFHANTSLSQHSNFSLNLSPGTLRNP